MFHALLETIRSYQTIIIHRHDHPDGDALGSQIGLKHLILHNFPDKTVYIVGDEAGRLSFMPGAKMDIIPDSTYDGALAIILDTSSPALISDPRYQLATATARIDHHIFQGKIADIEVVDTSFESCCGLIAQFAVECDLKLNSPAAQALYTGMVTDSGRFRYDSTTSRTFKLAALLREQDFNADEIYRNLYAETLESKQRKAQFILKAQFTPNNVAYIYTTKEELAEMKLDTFTASRGMVGTLADLQGVEIWANFTETEDGILCELRSSSRNINPIAVKYGGGGHAKASGARLPDRNSVDAMLCDLDQLIGEST
jgi:phosphoesterase RecJ-like protein